MFTKSKSAVVAKKSVIIDVKFEINAIDDEELCRAIGYDKHKVFFNDIIIPYVCNNVIDQKQLELITDYRKKVIQSAESWADLSRDTLYYGLIEASYDPLRMVTLENEYKKLDHIKLEIERVVIKSESTATLQVKL